MVWTRKRKIITEIPREVSWGDYISKFKDFYFSHLLKQMIDGGQ